MSEVSYLMSSSVLDLNAFERQNKAEGLGMVTEEGSSKWGDETRRNVSRIEIFSKETETELFGVTDVAEAKSASIIICIVSFWLISSYSALQSTTTPVTELSGSSLPPRRLRVTCFTRASRRMSSSCRWTRAKVCVLSGPQKHSVTSIST